jgi:serine/threonine protein kinase
LLTSDCASVLAFRAVSLEPKQYLRRIASLPKARLALLTASPALFGAQGLRVRMSSFAALRIGPALESRVAMDLALNLAARPDAYHSGLLLNGRYRLMHRLDEGGMSWVWLGQHLALDIPVAIKIIKSLPGISLEQGLREARITAGLRHAAVVTVLDSGCTEFGDAFVVMELLEGRSLASALANGDRMPARAAVALLWPVIDALLLCHRRGIVHRDIKPANVFLAHEHGRTRAKLLDFGVAQHLASRYERTSELSGTPGYMAPEQVLQQHLDQRADIWSVCAVLYEMVSGKRAIAGRSCTELLTATIAPAIVPLADDEEGTSGLWTILARGLRADPAERFPTMRAVCDALAVWRDQQAPMLTQTLHGYVPMSSEPSYEASESKSGEQAVFDDALCDTIAVLPRLKRRSVCRSADVIARRTRAVASLRGLSVAAFAGRSRPRQTGPCAVFAEPA